VTPAETKEHFFVQLDHGQWDIPQLSSLFTEILTANRSFQDFEVEYTFPMVGHKVLMLNARRLLLQEPPTDKHRILLAMEDITERRAAERQVEVRLAFLHHLLDALPSSVSLVQGSEARLVLANQAAMRIWGAEWPMKQPLLDFLQSHAITICDKQGLAMPTALCWLPCPSDLKRDSFHPPFSPERSVFSRLLPRVWYATGRAWLSRSRGHFHLLPRCHPLCVKA
jgi:hypothetical protein